MHTFAVVSFVSLLHAAPAKPGHAVHVRSLVMQSDERAERACSGASTVIIFENGGDVGRR